MKAHKPTPKAGKNGLKIVCDYNCKFHAGTSRSYAVNNCTYGKGHAYFDPVLCPPACAEYVEEYFEKDDYDGGNLKMYYWDDVFVDYSPGLCCVLARSVEHARVVLIEDMLEANKTSVGNGHDLLDMLTITDPDVVEGSGLAWVYGGG